MEYDRIIVDELVNEPSITANTHGFEVGFQISVNGKIVGTIVSLTFQTLTYSNITEPQLIVDPTKIRKLQALKSQLSRAKMQRNKVMISNLEKEIMNVRFNKA